MPVINNFPPRVAALLSPSHTSLAPKLPRGADGLTYEAPEPFETERHRDALHEQARARHMLVSPGPSYNAVVGKKAHKDLESMMLLCKRAPAAQATMQKQVGEVGWVEYLKGQAADRMSCYEIGADLAWLLRAGRITQAEYWTGSMMLALFGDSHGTAQPAEAAIDPHGNTARYVPGFVDWQACRTYDCSQPLPAGMMPEPFAEHLRTLNIRSPERFCYAICMNPGAAVPGFPYAQFGKNSFLDFIDVAGRAGVLLASATIHQESQNRLALYPVQLQPRVGPDTVNGLQTMQLAGKRPLGLAVLTPRRTLEPTMADGQVTGLAGFSGHDVEHAWVLGRISPKVRAQMIALHRHLKTVVAQFDHSASGPARLVGPLLRSNLFKFTDLAGAIGGLNEAETMAFYVAEYLGQNLFMLIRDLGAYNQQNVQKNLIAHLETDTLHTSLPQQSHAFTRSQARFFAAQLLDAPIDTGLGEINERWQADADRLFVAGLQWLKDIYGTKAWTSGVGDALKQTVEPAYAPYWDYVVRQCGAFFNGEKKEGLIPRTPIVYLAISKVRPSEDLEPYASYARSVELSVSTVLPDTTKSVIHEMTSNSAWYEAPQAKGKKRSFFSEASEPTEETPAQRRKFAIEVAG